MKMLFREISLKFQYNKKFLFYHFMCRFMFFQIILCFHLQHKIRRFCHAWPRFNKPLKKLRIGQILINPSQSLYTIHNGLCHSQKILSFCFNLIKKHIIFFYFIYNFLKIQVFVCLHSILDRKASLQKQEKE